MSEMEEDGKDFKVRERGCFIPKFFEVLLWQSVIIDDYICDTIQFLQFINSNFSDV